MTYFEEAKASCKLCSGIMFASNYGWNECSICNVSWIYQDWGGDLDSFCIQGEKITLELNFYTDGRVEALLTGGADTPERSLNFVSAVKRREEPDYQSKALREAYSVWRLKNGFS